MMSTNWKGWDPVVMIFSKLANRRESKICYNTINRILFGQWKDNKVLLFISTLPLMGNKPAVQQYGDEKVFFTCPKALQAYNKYMGYVDLVADKKIGGSFTHKSHVKKWYKKGLISILDFMLMNGSIVRNRSSQIKDIIRDMINNMDWRVYIAELMLNW